MGLLDFLFISQVIADEEDDDLILGAYDKPAKKKEHYCPRCGSWMFETGYGTWECSRCDTERDEDDLEDF